MSTRSLYVLAWHKSSHSTAQEDDTMCIEVASINGNLIAARDSKDPSGPHLHFTTGEWTAFLTRIKQERLR